MRNVLVEWNNAGSFALEPSIPREGCFWGECTKKGSNPKRGMEIPRHRAVSRLSTCATRRRNVYTIFLMGVERGGETKREQRKTERERESFFNTEGHISCFTQYNMAVQPSIVMHWKTVSMANPMLSKLVMPKFGPSQWSMHVEMFASHTWAPNGASDLLSVLHGLACSPSFTITSTTEWTSDRSLSGLVWPSSFLPSFLSLLSLSFYFSFLFFSIFLFY